MNFPGGSVKLQTVKCLPTMWETQLQALGQKDLLEKEMATHSRILAWRIQRNLAGYSQTRLKQLSRHACVTIGRKLYAPEFYEGVSLPF